MATIKLDKERKLLFSVQALDEINKKFGSLEKLHEEISKGSQYEQLSNIIWLITMMVNQASLENNMDIDLGVKHGEKEIFLTEEYVKVKLRVGDLKKYRDVIYLAVVEGSDFESEEGEDAGDPDLKEIEAEKNG